VGLDLDRVLGAFSYSTEVHGVLALEVGFGRVDLARAGENLSLAPAADNGEPGNGKH
jgi:hypothetical protein